MQDAGYTAERRAELVLTTAQADPQQPTSPPRDSTPEQALARLPSACVSCVRVVHHASTMDSVMIGLFVVKVSHVVRTVAKASVETMLAMPMIIEAAIETMVRSDMTNPPCCAEPPSQA